MKDKIHFSIIGLLVFIIVIISLYKENVMETIVVEDNDTECIEVIEELKENNTENLNTIETLEDELKLLKQELLVVDSEKNKLSDTLYTFTNGLANSSDTFVLLKDAQIDGVLLRIEYDYIEFCDDCDLGFSLLGDWDSITRTISQNDYVPIFVKDIGSTQIQVDWEYLTNLNYEPILRISQDHQRIYLIREEYQRGEPWRDND